MKIKQKKNIGKNRIVLMNVYSILKTIKRHFVLVILVFLCTFSFSTQAQNSQPKAEQDKSGVVLNFQNTDIQALINMVSEVTGKNFVVDPRVKAKVTLYSGSELDKSQIYDVFLSVLDVHNLSAVAVGDLVKIVPVASSKQLPLTTTYGRQNASQIADDLVTQVYKLEYATAADILPIIRPLIPAESHVAVHPRSGTLIFTDTAANVKRILDILNHLDVADTNFNIRIIPLKHAIASKLKEAISTLISNVVSEGENGTVSKKATIYADDGSNSLIINGSDEAYAIIESVVSSLDIERPKTRDLHVIQLKYAKAVEMSTILNEVGQRISPSPANDANNALSVQVHEPSNTLIIYANAADYQALKSVIDQLDIRPKQVFIEAIIAEVSFNKSADLGIQWSGNIDTDGGGTIGTNFGIPSDNSLAGLNFGIVNEIVLNNVGVAVPDLSVVLNALQSDSSTNILSTPNLLTVDNEKAEIVVGQQVPFVTGQFTTNQSQTTTTNNTTNNTTTTSVQPFQTIERKDVGLKLTVTPRVNADGLVTMVVEQEISNVSPRVVQGASDLVTDERRISATVQAKNGKVIVIGGLIRDDILKIDTQVPVLGDIPVLGNLFKSQRDQVVKTNLMVFLRPKILDENQEVSEYTQNKYDHMRGLSESQSNDKGRLLSYEGVEKLDSFDALSDANITKTNGSLDIETIWRYVLPETEYRTKSRF